MTTTDVVARLRNSHHEWVRGGHKALWELAHEAADEIERLRSEKQRLIEHEFGCSWDEPAADCEGENQCHRQFLKGEVERLNRELAIKYEREVVYGDTD